MNPDLHDHAARQQLEDPITALLAVSWAYMLSDNLGDVADAIRKAWRDVGLGDLDLTEDEIGFPSCDRFHEVTGYKGRSPGDLDTYTVHMVWRDCYGYESESTTTVAADSARDACRLAYNLEVLTWPGEPPYVRATCNGEAYDLEPVVGVIATPAMEIAQ
jgi:hypothetical protein